MIVKVPDAIDEAQSGTCFCSIGRQGRAGRADSQTGTQCGVVPRYARYVCTVQYMPTYPVFPGPPCRCFVVRCMSCKAERETTYRPIEADCPPRLPDRCAQGSDRKSSPFTDRRDPKGPALCAVRAWSTGASPLAHPIGPRLGQGSLGKASPGTGSWSCS